MTTTTVMRGDSITLPPDIRDRFGLAEGSVLVVETDEHGIHLRPGENPMIEIYTPERIAEFHLNNAYDDADYAWALDEVRRMGIDPATVLHDPSLIRRNRQP